MRRLRQPEDHQRDLVRRVVAILDDAYGRPVLAPRLPALGVRVAIPQGETLVAVRIVPGAAQQLAENIRIRHVERPYPLSRPELAGAATPRNPAIYESNARYPAHPGVARGARSKRGVAFEELVLHPVAYEPASGRIYWHEEIAVEVETKPVSRARGQGAAVPVVVPPVRPATRWFWLPLRRF